MSEINLKEVLDYVQEHIPITVHLGAAIPRYDGSSLTVTAPLAENLNHRQSAFGGSLSAIAILSGWALLFVKLRELGIRSRLVIQKTEFDFLAPVTDDFESLSRLPTEQKYDRFIKMLTTKGRARLVVESEVTCDGQLCGTHKGTFVAVLLTDH
ncbi:thioesterase domain-containing protein [Verrucomicrobiaceae bacterium R5-34]|uniref:Thioesterase domain-containing protein n=1 Tax=Oceaniferula flava TaxID=2800421 RepID=A0AAE2SBH6_9BACT|nr:YiiD C-terminal domain-containing protein [Oceaniferula flavus]MBK1831239.1 thioesterase domain-containing protein [Verrucomicrobiaceae bacterium R5-34]MBK1855408.1 thioesterase domain-containing protein [Oceaniferula flavus]MBM1136714.1 thioesterase domain-containing protein [Oceaniferula flavus]